MIILLNTACDLLEWPLSKAPLAFSLAFSTHRFRPLTGRQHRLDRGLRALARGQQPERHSRLAGGSTALQQAGEGEVVAATVPKSQGVGPGFGAPQGMAKALENGLRCGPGTP